MSSEGALIASAQHNTTHPPVNHSREPLPGAEGGHVFQLLVSDPDWHQELLRIAGAKPAEGQREQWSDKESERESETDRRNQRAVMAQQRSLSTDT